MNNQQEIVEEDESQPKTQSEVNANHGRKMKSKFADEKKKREEAR